MAILYSPSLISPPTQSLPPSSPRYRLPSILRSSGRSRQQAVRRLGRMGSASSTPRASLAAGFGPTTADALGGVSIVAVASGEPVLFRDLWDQNEGIAVVALLRHFGCPCCWELASVLRDSKSRFDQTGAKVIAVGVGTADKARILAERLPFPLDCLYADPDRKAYDILGLYYGLGRTFFNPASVKVFSRYDSLRKAVKNYTIAATPDDRGSVLQQEISGRHVRSVKERMRSVKERRWKNPEEEPINEEVRDPGK